MKVTGSGTIQLTQNATDRAQSIRNDAIGMWEVSGFEISGIRAIGGTTPYIGLYFNENGVVRGTTLNEPAGPTVSGIEVVSSQHVVVERNVLRNPDGSPGATDDGIALATNYGDPRATGWWRSTTPRPLVDVVVRDNVVEAECCSALAFIPWGTSAADKRTIEWRDIVIEDNTFNAPSGWDSVKCWCDSFHPGNPYLENGGFEQTGIVNWSTSGTAAQVGADTASVGQSGSWFGYIRFRARVQTSGDPVRMYVHNQCTGATVAAKWVRNTSWSTEELAFTTTTACSNYHVGIDSSGQTTT